MKKNPKQDKDLKGRNTGSNTLVRPCLDHDDGMKIRHQKEARPVTSCHKKVNDVKPKPTRKEAPRPDNHANVVVRVQRSGVKAVRRQLVTARGPLQDMHLRMPGRSFEGKAYHGENPLKATNWRRQGSASKWGRSSQYDKSTAFFELTYNKPTKEKQSKSEHNWEDTNNDREEKGQTKVDCKKEARRYQNKLAEHVTRSLSDNSSQNVETRSVMKGTPKWCIKKEREGEAENPGPEDSTNDEEEDLNSATNSEKTI